MRKKLAVVLATMFTAGSIGTAFAAEDSFSDVPKDHWSYSAVQTIVKSGIVKGYDNHTFQGDRPISRYEMAVIVAKAMDNIKKADAPTQKLVDKMTKEYDKELKAMKVRVAKLEKRVSAIKPSPIDWSGSNFGFEYNLMRKTANGVSYTENFINGMNKAGTTGLKNTNNQSDVTDTFRYRTELVANSRLTQGFNLQIKLASARNQFGTAVIDKKYNSDGTLDVTEYKAYSKVGAGTLTVGHMRADMLDGLVLSSALTGVKYSIGDKAKFDFYNGKMDNYSATQYIGSGQTGNAHYVIPTDINPYYGINLYAATMTYPINGGKTNLYGALYRTRSYVASYKPASIWEAAFNTKISPIFTLSGDYAHSNRSANNTAYNFGVLYKGAKKEVQKSGGFKAEYVRLGSQAYINSGSDFANTSVNLTATSVYSFGDVTYDSVNATQKLNSTNGEKGFQLTYQYIPLKNCIFTARYLQAKPINGTDWDKVRWVSTGFQFYF